MAAEADIPLDLEGLIGISSAVSFRDWQQHIEVLSDRRGWLIQWRFRDPITGEPHHSRKWYVSRWASRTEVVQTWLAAALAAVEHEAREDFRVHDVPAYGPHIHIDEHVRIAGVLDPRTEGTD